MLAGINQHAARLERRGIDAAFTTGFQNNYTSGITLDNEQESLKADLTTKTQELKDIIKVLDAQYSEAKKTVKIEMEQSTWAAFGFQDKR